jgi:hypothetical protein
MQMGVICPREHSDCHCFVPGLLLYGQSNDSLDTLESKFIFEILTVDDDVWS